MNKMKTKAVILTFSVLLTLVFLSGCIASDDTGKSAESLITGKWVSDKPVDTASLSYAISDDLKNNLSFTELWSYEGNWSYNGTTDDGYDEYIAAYKPNGGFTVFFKAFLPLKLHHGLTVESPAYKNGDTCSFFTSDLAPGLFDIDGYTYTKVNESEVSGDEPITGIWIDENSEYDYKATLVFNEDKTMKENWEYYGFVEYLELLENGDYKYNLTYAHEDWNSNVCVSKDGDVFTDSEGNKFHKI